MAAQETLATSGEVNSASGGVRKRLLIDGELVSLDKTFPSLNPATGEVYGHAPDAGVAEAKAAVEAARRAFDTTDWSTNVEFRIKCLDQLHQAMLDNLEDLRELTMAEVERPASSPTATNSKRRSASSSTTRTCSAPTPSAKTSARSNSVASSTGVGSKRKLPGWSRPLPHTTTRRNSRSRNSLPRSRPDAR